ncbi:aldo/keto reductase [Solihabitans fulvus]|uniref:Aldo/keto reductase n=1 Tax=Solihabitans fulvus TaxID=1892852 RepID=A0A5B2XDD7_9PSEU|nr:aldo/keto reductase [Solihabitans fulvus]KAA2261236.1 aldo/keto reductase [Solihabitans fulvus]
MRYTLLGKTGLRVSELSLGTMTFGDSWGADKATSGQLLDAYADAGGNFVDTANFYTGGQSEEYLGELLEGRRDQFVLATKYTLQTRSGDVNSVGNTRKNLVNSLEDSLRRLRTDHVDVLWVHARDTWTPVAEVMRALDDQVRAGKILHVAVSDWPAWEVAQANTLAELRDWSPFVGLQIRYNLLERTVERELLPMAKAFDLPVFAWAPLAAGKLTGKYRAGESGRLTGRDDGPTDHNEDETIDTVLAVAEEGGWSPAQVAIAWLLRQPANVVPILGATTLTQLKDNLGAVDVRLTDDQLARLDTASRVPLGFPHDFLAGERVTNGVYGDRWQEVDDRRFTVRRTPGDR